MGVVAPAAAADGEGGSEEPWAPACAEVASPDAPVVAPEAPVASLEAPFDVPAAWPGTAVALAVALDVDCDDVGSGPQATCVPVTGRRPSISPVSVAITFLG